MKATWQEHGTKILGTAATVVGALQGAVIVMNPTPPAAPLIPWKVMAVIAGLNTFLGLLTVKRGFTNTAAAADDGAQSGT